MSKFAGLEVVPYPDTVPFKKAREFDIFFLERNPQSPLWVKIGDDFAMSEPVFKGLVQAIKNSNLSVALNKIANIWMISPDTAVVVLVRGRIEP